MTDALGFAPALRMAGPIDTQVPGHVAEQMLAALREALANAAKHAQASRVDVTVEAGAELVLTVRDNGVGPDEHHAPQRAGQSRRTRRRTGRDGTHGSRPRAAAPNWSGGFRCRSCAGVAACVWNRPDSSKTRAA